MENHILSKSTYIRGLQCPKSLYLYKNFIHLRDPISNEQKSIFNRGNSVGVLAQKLFPDGTDVSKSTNTRDSNRYVKMVETTKQLIESGAEVIYEAAFQYKGVLVILDILVIKNDQWFAYEVKSSTRITQTYLTDASLQYWVITNSGLSLEDISIIIINNQYVRNGQLNLHGLFSVKSIKKDVLRNYETIEQNVTLLKQVIADPRMPDVKIGEHCFTPYNCDFMGTCWKNIPENSVFEIAASQKAELFNLYNSGYETIDQIPENNALDKNANIHIQAFKRGEGALVNKDGIKEFIDKITYPLFFMDFETFMPAVPIYDNTKPYQHIPFQYSIHYKKSKESVIEHFYFLAEQGLDPRKQFLKSLLKDTETNGTILVYDALMESNILNGLKNEFPEYTDAIDLRLKRFVDLMKPFQEKMYYHPAMKNSFSIKNVLPALVPDLSYNNLAIASGSIAMIAFENLKTETDMFKIQEIRHQLLKYCELDTLAMVKIFEVLEKESNS